MALLKIRHNLVIEKPKLIFFSRKHTIYNFKRHLIKIFSYLKDKSTKAIRLWVLDNNLTFENFEEFLKKSFKDNLENPIYFPGYSLEKYNDYMIGNLENILSEHIIVLEHQNDKGNFIFRNQHNFEIKSDDIVK